MQDLPLETIFDVAVDTGGDGFWIEKQGKWYVLHLVQVKAGGKEEAIHCGDDPEAKSTKTLVSIKYKLLRQYLNIKRDLRASKVKYADKLKMGSLTLLSTKEIKGLDDFREMEKAKKKTLLTLNGVRDHCKEYEKIPKKRTKTPPLKIISGPQKLLPLEHSLFYQ